MAVKDVLPTENLKWEDVRDTLNAEGGRVSNDIASAFKPEAKINIWSKHKPVELINTPFCQDFNPNKPNYKKDWWKGTEGNCGLVPKVVTSHDDIINNIDGNLNGWTYDLPRGGEREPLRLGDFAGYYANAIPPVFNLDATPSKVISSRGRLVVGCSINLYNDRSVTFADLRDFSQYYFGALVKKKNSTMYEIATSKQNMSQPISPSIEFNMRGASTGYWQIIPFIAENPIDQDSPGKLNFYATLPNVKTLDIEVIANEVHLFGTLDYYGLVFCDYKITATNYINEKITLRNNYLTIKYNGNKFEDPMQVGEAQVKLPDFTIPANTSHLAVASGKITVLGIQDAGPNGMYGIISLDSGRIRNTIGIRDHTGGGPRQSDKEKSDK